VNIFLLFKGFSVGLVFSSTTVAATVWCIQLGRRRGIMAAMTAAGAVTLGQVLWAMLAVVTVGMLSWDAPQYVAAARAFCGTVFTYMAIKSVRSLKLKELPPLEGTMVGPMRLATATLAVMLSMPMRFFGLVGMLLAGRMTRRPMDETEAIFLVIGVGAGTLLWFGFVSALAGILRERVEAEFWVRAVWRQTRLATVVYAGLAVIVAAPTIWWWAQRTA
jgi:threonine/homoserine/homoserine lactone efflux protein